MMPNVLFMRGRAYNRSVLVGYALGLVVVFTPPPWGADILSTEDINLTRSSLDGRSGFSIFSANLIAELHSHR